MSLHFWTGEFFLRFQEIKGKYYYKTEKKRILFVDESPSYTSTSNCQQTNSHHVTYNHNYMQNFRVSMGNLLSLLSPNLRPWTLARRKKSCLVNPRRELIHQNLLSIDHGPAVAFWFLQLPGNLLHLTISLLDLELLLNWNFSLPKLFLGHVYLWHQPPFQQCSWADQPLCHTNDEILTQ